MTNPVTSPYRGRLAPSPTGPLHLGHARTSLIAWLRARQAGGSLVMRIEDLDGPRVVEGAAARIEHDLQWLGLDWDEGPFHQSERGHLYEEALAQLDAGGHVYRCSCSRKEIAAVASAPHGAEDLGIRYPGTCRAGPTDSDRPCAIRFRMPEPPPAYVDGLHGAVDTSAMGGDFVVRRADGVWSYQLAVVVDDAAMGITEVVRGDDLLSSTPRQLGLYHALGRPEPCFVHVPLVLGPDGQRLSKRHAATAIADYRDWGMSPEEVVGMLAGTLGLDATPRSPGALLESFDLGRVPSEPTVLDPAVLEPTVLERE